MADTGIKVWDEVGNLIIDITDALSRVNGILFVPGGGTAVVTDDIFLTGRPFPISLLSQAVPGGITDAQYPPRISFAGNQMFVDNTAPSGDHRVIYGSW